MKRPAFQFYPADWQKDAALQSCAIGARGLWIEMLCIMHQCEPYGHLAVNGKAMTNEQLARLIGETPAFTRKALTELEAAAVFSRDDAGCIFSRRMVKDERIRNVRAEAGKLGGNPLLLDGKDKQKVNQTVNDVVNLRPTPSSSSSSSPTEKQKPSAFAPPDWIPSDAWDAFIESRNKRKKPMSDFAKKLAVRELEGLREKGHDPRQVIERAVLKGWLTFYAPQDQQDTTPRYVSP